ncbi:MAG: ImpA family type VI secretion system protein, partial [Bilophila wadsworthia]
REDDPGLPQGVWERELKRADWDKALSLSLGVLRERSKDMQVAGWACEAALMRYGFASLPGGLRMIAGLCSGFGDGLHPQPEGSDQEARLARLAWLDSTLAERAASLPITEASPDVPAATYADWMAMEHRERIQGSNGKNGVAGVPAYAEPCRDTDFPGLPRLLHGQLRSAAGAGRTARAADALAAGRRQAFMPCWTGWSTSTRGCSRGIPPPGRIPSYPHLPLPSLCLRRHRHRSPRGNRRMPPFPPSPITSCAQSRTAPPLGW